MRAIGPNIRDGSPWTGESTMNANPSRDGAVEPGQSGQRVEVDADERETFLYRDLPRFRTELFQFDPRMARGWLSDRYFVRAANTLGHARRNPRVTLQLFAKQPGTVAGIWEAIRMLQSQLAEEFVPADLEVDTLLEADRFEPWETVMLIRGPYRAFAHLETDILGVLARRTTVASQTQAVVDAAAGRPVIFMPARHDDWRVQVADGYAALR